MIDCVLQGYWLGKRIEQHYLRCEENHAGCNQIISWLLDDVQIFPEAVRVYFENSDDEESELKTYFNGNAHTVEGIGSFLFIQETVFFEEDIVPDRKVFLTHDHLLDLLEKYDAHYVKNKRSKHAENEIRFKISYICGGEKAGKEFKKIGGRIQEDQFDDDFSVKC